MHLKRRLERLERRLQAEKDQRASVAYFEILVSILADDEGASDAWQRFAELEKQWPAEQRQRLEELARELEAPMKTVEESIMEDWPTPPPPGFRGDTGPETLS